MHGLDQIIKMNEQAVAKEHADAQQDGQESYALAIREASAQSAIEEAKGKK